MMAMIAVPIAMTFLFSLNDWNLLMGNGMRFNWGKNYLDVLASREFWQSLGITFYYTAIATVEMCIRDSYPSVRPGLQGIRDQRI